MECWVVIGLKLKFIKSSSCQFLCHLSRRGMMFPSCHSCVKFSCDQSEWLNANRLKFTSRLKVWDFFFFFWQTVISNNDLRSLWQCLIYFMFNTIAFKMMVFLLSSLWLLFVVGTRNLLLILITGETDSLWTHLRMNSQHVV